MIKSVIVPSDELLPTEQSLIIWDDSDDRAYEEDKRARRSHHKQ